MKKLILAAALSTAAIPAAHAGMIERACLGSERAGVSRALCGCIQDVADGMLDFNDQRLASSFFRDPHQAQVIRQSDDILHEIFWRKYKEFGARAEQSCS